MAVLSLTAKRPPNLGVHDGRLAPCPGTPNCVCSQDADPEHAIAPLTFTGEPNEAWQALRTAIERQPRVHVVTASERYLHAEFTSLVFRFVDDAEFLIDPERQVIHFRSASRAGRSDFGV